MLGLVTLFVLYWVVRAAIAHGMWDAWDRRARHERKTVHQSAVRAAADLPQGPEAAE
ncbi:hypothetical protein GCM10009662_47240 [Catellatospora coxensis]|uniref:Uncharacterized protein n=1 Tax=Catellatospora coxensis TaxID=310354 RepID=A0A8J3L919_9ACTN|nr:hypothetical protein Cco03nite_80490 [Catellatospora coxensis]